MPQNNKISFFLIDYSVTGGVEKVIANLSYLFNQANYKDIHLITLYSKNETPKFHFDEGIKIHKLSSNKSSFTFELSKILQENSISNLIFQGDNMTIALNALKACEIANCNPILHYHGSPYAYLKKYIFKEDLKEKPTLIFNLLWSKIQYPFKKNKLRKVISKASNGTFVCVSNGSNNELKKIFKLSRKISDKIITIHNPILFEQKCNLDYSKKDKRISYVARLTKRHKNSMLIVKAWSEVSKKYPDWILQIIGDGELKNAMESFLNSKDVKNVVFTGMIKNVSSYLQKSSIAINTSHCEGFGLAMAEAGYFKNALISTNSDGGITDIIKDKESGIITPKNDALKLANSISLLIEDERLREKYAIQANNRILEIANKDIINQWVSILKNI